MTPEGIKREKDIDHAKSITPTTGNFKARIEEAGFNWPPPSPINYPAKDW
jgi:hypothetical protein